MGSRLGEPWAIKKKKLLIFASYTSRDIPVNPHVRSSWCFCEVGPGAFISHHAVAPGVAAEAPNCDFKLLSDRIQVNEKALSPSADPQVTLQDISGRYVWFCEMCIHVAHERKQTHFATDIDLLVNQPDLENLFRYLNIIYIYIYVCVYVCI